MDPSSSRSLAFETAVSASREVLENGARAAVNAEAEARASCFSSAAASASAAGKSAMEAARLALESTLSATTVDDDGHRIDVRGWGGSATRELARCPPWFLL